MRGLTYFIAVTLDGFIAGPDRSDPSGPNGFWPLTQDYITHLVTNFPETLPGPAREALGVTTSSGRFDTALMGRTTYEIGRAAGVTNPYPHLRSLVFSRSIADRPDPSVELVTGSPAERVRALKNEPGANLWLVGGGELAAALYDEIDDLVLKIAPITIGSGVPLFGGAFPSFQLRSWQPTGTSTLPSGVSFVSLERPA